MADPLRAHRLSGLRLWGPLSRLVLAVAGFVFLIDQAFKWWMVAIFDIDERPPVVLTPFFELVMAWNRGVSYGLFSTHQQAGLIALALVITAFLWLWASGSSQRLTAYALALIIGGALSNALDRAIHGAVADFFHFHWGTFSWYVFNLADVAIVAGVALLLYESFFVGGSQPRRGNA